VLDTARGLDQDGKGTIKASPTTPAGVLSPPGAAAYHSTDPFSDGIRHSDDVEMGFAGDLAGKLAMARAL